MTNLAVYTFTLPLLAGFLMWFVGRLGNRPAKAFSALTSLITTVLSGKILFSLLKGSSAVVVFGGWSPPLGINFFLDPLAGLWLFSANLLMLLSVMGSGMKFSWRFYGLLMILLAGLNGLIMSGDLFNIFVFFEIVCLVSFALVAYYKKRESMEAGVKYFVLGSVASSLFLLAIALIYGKTGTLNMAQISYLSGNWSMMFKLVVFALILVGLGVESGIFPLNAWLFDAHPSAPFPVSALLSGIVIESALYVLLRLVSLFFVDKGAVLLVGETLLLLGALTFIVAEVVGFYQRDVKRALAYSSAGQIGLMLMAFAVGLSRSDLGSLAFVLLFSNHLLAKGGLFLSVGAVSDRSGSRDLGEFAKECAFSDKVVGLVGGLSLVGAPPFLGFWGKVALIFGLLAINMYALVAVLLAVMVLEGMYIMRISSAMLLSKGEGRQDCPGQALSLWILSLLMLGAGILTVYGVRKGVDLSRLRFTPRGEYIQIVYDVSAYKGGVDING